ncbi:MAG: deoxyuridine 5'-triphosphate nucleotidohydrolase [Dehalococcoidia bacterium]|nr:deoxyuridine 5'-triphosphate nucleotidohydrolase [Dehalococcoidia bacterium]
MAEKSFILTRVNIEALLNETPPLIEEAPRIQDQVQPNGIDLTIKEITSFSSPGSIGFSNEVRVLARNSPSLFGNSEATNLPAGCYLITYNEIVHLPRDIMALGLPRSSLLRCGVSIHTAVWDAGYSGRSQSLLTVHNPAGFYLYRNARAMQLIFFHLSQEVEQGYNGIFQGENIQAPFHSNRKNMLE